MENNRSKDKAAKYARVYNQILHMIQEGMYPEGSKLVSEPSLALDLQVSRSTLRQALNLLQEDGIIEARRGVGNFVRKTIDINATGLEQMGNPLFKSCTKELHTSRIEVVPGISTAYTERIFKRKMPVVLAIHRFYEDTEGVQAYCFSHIASDCQYLNQMDLHDNQAVLDFMEMGIYSYAHARRCEIRVVQKTDNLQDKHIQNATGLFQMILERITDKNGDVILLNKFYIPIENALIKVFSSNS